ncbi:hypothetical protein V1514DRAFT_323004 [Lipomyces japonicus]|uniref:uncharacterized protein n=1 Tax=Lipomyces japonicus TaxID=56871 RepID=UPI0034CFD733
MKEKRLQFPSDWMDMPITADVTSVTPLSTPAGIVIRHHHVDTATPALPSPSTPSTPPSTRLASPPSTGTDRLPTHEPPVAAVGATPTPAPRQTRALAPPSLVRRIKSVSPNKSSRITRSMARSALQIVTSPDVAVVDTEMTEAADDTGPLSTLPTSS